jgi:hypothetical protein
MKRLIKLGLSLAVVSSLFVGCSNDSDVVSKNLSQEADNFKVDRRIVFYNGITGDYMLTLEGKCALGNSDPVRQLTVTCKTGEDQYKKHFLGLSDNVTYFVEQIESRNVSAYHYKVTFKPQEILPDVDFRGDAQAVKKAVTPDSND